MAGATYTEKDLHAAFICGVNHGQENPKGDPAAVSENWIDVLFYQGFRSDTLFNRPGYHNEKPEAAKAGK
ncbi:MAG: hypothetical protein WB729_05110 [Candidatus Sulfotelmatobacter sp.]